MAAGRAAREVCQALSGFQEEFRSKRSDRSRGPGKATMALAWGDGCGGGGAEGSERHHEKNRLVINHLFCDKNPPGCQAKLCV